MTLTQVFSCEYYKFLRAPVLKNICKRLLLFFCNLTLMQSFGRGLTELSWFLFRFSVTLALFNPGIHCVWYTDCTSARDSPYQSKRSVYLGKNSQPLVHSLYGNSLYVLFMTSKWLGVFQLNFDSLIKGSLETFLQSYL